MLDPKDQLVEMAVAVVIAIVLAGWMSSQDRVTATAAPGVFTQESK